MIDRRKGELVRTLVFLGVRIPVGIYTVYLVCPDRQLQVQTVSLDRL